MFKKKNKSPKSPKPKLPKAGSSSLSRPPLPTSPSVPSVSFNTPTSTSSDGGATAQASLSPTQRAGSLPSVPSGSTLQITTSGNGLGLLNVDSMKSSPIEIERRKGAFGDLSRTDSRSPEPAENDPGLPPEHLRPSSRWWQHKKDKSSRPWRNLSPSPRRRAKSVSSDRADGSRISSSPPNIHSLNPKASPKPPQRFIVPPEQEEAYQKTALAVARATGEEVWDGTKVITHDILEAGLEVIRIVPIPGIFEAISSLVQIWNYVGQVETNRMACLHLAERCAGILNSVRDEVNIAGPNVAAALADPMRNLTETFHDIASLMQKLTERPFIKRYLKREEIQLQILEAHEKLTDDLQLFGLAIQVRILRELKEHPTHSPKNAHDDPAATIASPASPLPMLPPPAYPDIPTHDPAGTVASKSSSMRPQLSRSDSSAPTDGSNDNSSSSSFVLPDIAAHHHDRFAQDCQLDNADLRRIIKDVMDANSDERLIEVLQVQKPEMAEAIRTLRRALEDPHLSSPNVRRGSTTGSLSSSEKQSTHATKSIHTLPVEENPEELKIHREFIEEEIEALRRSSGDGDELPSWTITRWEIDRAQQIGVGYFSEVFKGQWKGELVAIKVLSPTTPADLFLHEAQIWQTLSHPNILPLLGASSTSSNPPWFFVSPYMRNGSLIKYLKAHPGQANYLQMIQEIAVGMDYLHKRGVLHGDLKAVNVLVDDELHCVISDFGQSKLKNEVYRLSHAGVPGGTLRWLSPELLQDSFTPLTWQADVYAFAVSCSEVLMDGELPWPSLSDTLIRHVVLDNNERPSLPTDRMPADLVDLISRCWARAAVDRPSFEHIAAEMTQILITQVDITPRPPLLPELDDTDSLRAPQQDDGHRSPHLEPTEKLQDASPYDDTVLNPAPNEPSPVSSSDDSQSFLSMLDSVSSPSQDESDERHPLPGAGSRPPQPQLDHSMLTMRRPPSFDDGYESPVPQDEVAAEKRNESRYRYYLVHPHHVSLNLPLWTPSEVKIGDVGYHKRPEGSFIKLFNAFDPIGTSTSHWHGGIPVPPLKGIQMGSQTEEKRNVIQRGIDWVGGFLRTPLPRTPTGTSLSSNNTSSPPVTPGGESATSGSGSGTATPSTSKPFGFGIGRTPSSASVSPDAPRQVSRKYDFVLRAKHKRALIVAESTVYRYVTSPTLDTAKDWFAKHRQTIMDTFGRRHHLAKEDLLLVIGTLDTKDYGLFVNHKHPDGMAHFNIYGDRREGEPFGVWTTDTNVLKQAGPRYNEDPVLSDAPRLSANKVSIVRAEPAPYHTLILARLRFKPDSEQPTSL